MDKTNSTINDNSTSAAKPEHASVSSRDAFSRGLFHLKVVSNIHLILLEINIDDKSSEGHTAMTELQNVSDTIHMFRDRDQCIDFLTDSDNDKVCMIIPDVLCQSVVPLVHDFIQLQTIFILYKEKNNLEEWIQGWSKIKGIFTDIPSICKALKKAAYQSDQNTIPISVVEADENISSKSLDKLNCSFMYTQIIKEILFAIKFEEKDIKEFFYYCRNGLIAHEDTLMKVNELEREYHGRTPIWWYTSQSLFFSVLNRALRTMEVEIIIKMGFFINDLHRQIQQLHVEQYKRHHTSHSFTVYRGQGMSQIDFDQLMKAKGGLISFNNFLSTSKNRDVSFLFAESNASNPNLVGIFFVVTIDPSKSTTPFALVNDVGSFGDAEEEVLFSMHTVFRVGHIEPTPQNQRVFQVDLTLTNDDDKDLRALTDHIRAETFPNSRGWYRLGQLLLKLGQSDKAEQVYQLLLEQATEESEKAPIYHQLATAKQNQGKYEEAVKFSEKSLAIQQQSLPSNHPDLAKSYNSIGMVYANMREYPKALASYEKALAIQQQSLPSNHPDLAKSYNNIGTVYDSMHEYSKALVSYGKALAIQQQSFPSNHPDLASSYNNIACGYRNIRDYSKALSFYEKALAIQLQSLPPEHPDLAITYSNIGVAYRNLGEYLKALPSYEKALAIQQQLLPSNHPDLAITYRNIGVAHRDLGEYLKAHSSYEKALEIQEQLLPSNRLDLAITYSSIGAVLCRLDEYSKALSCYQKALAIRQQSLSSNHSDLLSSYNNIGAVYDSLGEYSKALSYYEKVLPIQQQSLPANHLGLALTHYNIGLAYENMGDYSKAQSFYERAVNIAQHSSPSDDHHLQIYRKSLEDIKKKLESAFCEKQNKMIE